MNNPRGLKQGRIASTIAAAYAQGKEYLFSLAIFRRLISLVAVSTLLTSAYWLFVASDRYVSEANVIIEKTDLVGAPAFDLSMLFAGANNFNRQDQLLLREYLLSVDMLGKLDSALDLRTHYSDWRRDIVSRMWFGDAPLEWFYRYYLNRVSVEFDDYTGVLRIKAQAYDAKTAQAITSLLVHEGERYMNHIGHELAQAQVLFLTTQVDIAKDNVMRTRRALLEFQNKKGLVSPQATAEGIGAIIAKLEEQRASIKTQLASLPPSLIPNHPNILMLKQSLEAVESQITQERSRLAAPSGKTLNYTVEEYQRLEMEVAFAQDIYKTALVGLEKGRMDATRTLKMVSSLQSPVLPEYPMEPRRFYNSLATLLIGILLIGIIRLLESIILDHVD